MEKINFWEIFKKAFGLSWKNKSLWWFGLIIGSGSSLNLNLPFPSSKETSAPQFSSEQIQSFITQHFSLLVFLSTVFLVLLLAFGIFKILSYSGLVQELARLEKGNALGFWGALKEGKKYLWRVLGTKLLFSFFIFVLILILALPPIFLFSIKSIILGFITAFLAFLILFPALIIFSFIEKFGVFYILLSDLKLQPALEQGYKILLKNIWPSIVMSLLFLPLSILTGIASLMFILAISAPFVVLGFVIFKLNLVLGMWLIGILGGLILLTSILALRSFLGVFYTTAWFLFFKEIASVKKEEIEVKEEVFVPAENIQPEKI